MDMSVNEPTILDPQNATIMNGGALMNGVNQVKNESNAQQLSSTIMGDTSQQNNADANNLNGNESNAQNNSKNFLAYTLVSPQVRLI